MQSRKALKDTIIMRAMPGTKKRILEAVENSPDRYQNLSHFIRCAVERLLRAEEERKIYRQLQQKRPSKSDARIARRLEEEANAQRQLVAHRPGKRDHRNHKGGLV
jgi:Arc/MetJ-type ribon-helix-helix transcriptional regulator